MDLSPFHEWMIGGWEDRREGDVHNRCCEPACYRLRAELNAAPFHGDLLQFSIADISGAAASCAVATTRISTPNCNC